jgi:hypothetical protein
MLKYRLILISVLSLVLAVVLATNIKQKTWDFEVINARGDGLRLTKAIHLRCKLYRYSYNRWSENAMDSSSGSLDYRYAFDLNNIDWENHRLDYEDVGTKETMEFLPSADSLTVFLAREHGGRMVTVFAAHTEPQFETFGALFVVDSLHEHTNGLSKSSATDVESEFGECVPWSE